MKAALKLAVVSVLLCLAGNVLAAANVVGTMGGSYAVNASGAFSYSIPINGEPGIGGTAPRLTLNYSSQAGYSWTGNGWSVGGLSAITRCQQTMAQDSKIAPVQNTLADKFCLDGNRLVAIAGTYGKDGTEYRTEIDSFQRIISHGIAGNGPAWFEVWTKSGQHLQYGNTADSQLLANTDGTMLLATVSRWSLNDSADLKGNHYQVTYNKDAYNQYQLPARINYNFYTPAAAGSTSTPSAYIAFVYNTVPASSSRTSYDAGSRRITPSTLAALQLGTSYNGTSTPLDSMRRQYKLVYQAALGTAAGYDLQTVQECAYTAAGAASESCLKPLTLGYNAPPASGFTTSTAVGGLGFGSATSPNFTTRFVADVNGDGINDLVGINSSGVSAAYGSASGTFSGVQSIGSGMFNWPSQPDTLGIDASYRLVADLNHDGKSDVVGFKPSPKGTNSGGTFVGLSTGSVIQTPSLAVPDSVSATYTDDTATYSAQTMTGTYNFGSTTLNLGGSSGFSSVIWTNTFGMTRTVVDLNGDGCPDILGIGIVGVLVSSYEAQAALGDCSGGFGNKVYWGGGPSTGGIYSPTYNFGDSNTWLFSPVSLDATTSATLNNDGCSAPAPQFQVACAGAHATEAQEFAANFKYVTDVDGDGLADIVGFTEQGVIVYHSTGSRFADGVLWTTNFAGNNSQRISCTFSPTSSTFAPTNVGINWVPDCPRFLADVNGDGLPDIVAVAANGDFLVALNTGASFEAPTGWGHLGGDLTSYLWSMNQAPRQLVDVNGDGLADMVTFASDGVYVSYSTGNTFATAVKVTGLFAGRQSNNSPLWTTSNDLRVVADMDGDGLADIVGFGDNTAGGNGVQILRQSTTPVQIDRLKQITDELGKSIVVSYAPISGSIYTRPASVQKGQYPALGAMYVTSALSVDSGTPTSQSYGYAYAGGVYDLAGRGFLGFSQVSETAPGNVLNISNYGQTFPYIGTLVSSIHKVDGVTLKTVANTLSPQSGIYAGVTYPEIPTTVTKTYDLATGGLLNTQTDTVTAYNADVGTASRFFNPATVTTTVADASNVTQYTKTTQNFYCPVIAGAAPASSNPACPASGTWLIDLVQQTSISQARPGVPNVSNTTSYAYDASGVLSQTTVEPATPQQSQHVLQFDANGNITQDTVTAANLSPAQRITKYFYNAGTDYPPGLFKSSMIDPANYTEQWTYDVTSGALPTSDSVV